MNKQDFGQKGRKAKKALYLTYKMKKKETKNYKYSYFVVYNTSDMAII